MRTAVNLEWFEQDVRDAVSSGTPDELRGFCCACVGTVSKFVLSTVFQAARRHSVG